MTTAGLSGRGLQQSPEQWAARGRALTDAMAALIATHRPAGATTALDVGCQDGRLLDDLAGRTEIAGLRWSGVDPRVDGEARSPGGRRLGHGYAHALDVADESVDVVLFANVFEHVRPELRDASLAELARVLRPGGVVVGQIPNPYFPIESHSRLPFLGVLPARWQRRYWSLSSVPWDHDFSSVTLRHLRRAAQPAGLRMVFHRQFNYPLAAIPSSVRPLARLATPVLRVYPWAWQFVLARR